MCLPGCVVNLPTINHYDENDIINFGLTHHVDFIAVSFTRRSSDIQYVRKILVSKDPTYAKKVKIISKIENFQALQNLDQIIAASDGIMIARGDLGMQTPLQKIVLIQKLITAKCLKQTKFLVVATQMIESMQSKPRPTRAEVSDITNSVLDLVDSTMTSGETATGQFPVQTINFMNKVSSENIQISVQSQKVCDYERIFRWRLENNLIQRNENALKIVSISFEKSIDIILIKTTKIQLINYISCYRPRAFIFLYTKQEDHLKKEISLHYGVYAFCKEKYPKVQLLIQQLHRIFGFQRSIKMMIVEHQMDQSVEIDLKQINFQQ